MCVHVALWAPCIVAHAVHALCRGFPPVAAAVPWGPVCGS